MEIYREWHHITKELKMDIRVADMKILDTSQNKDLLGQVITDVVLALLSYVAEGLRHIGKLDEASGLYFTSCFG